MTVIILQLIRITFRNGRNPPRLEVRVFRSHHQFGVVQSRAYTTRVICVHWVVERVMLPPAEELAVEMRVLHQSDHEIR